MLDSFSLWHPSPLPHPLHPPPRADPPRESREKTSSMRPQAQSIWLASVFTMLLRKSLLGRFPGAFTRPEMKINLRAQWGVFVILKNPSKVCLGDSSPLKITPEYIP